MKQSIYILSAFMLVMILLQSCSRDKKLTNTSNTKYTCPMHPQIVQDAPGTCPICQMTLVPMNQAGNDMELMLNASQIQLANVQTIKVGTGSFGSSKILNGRLISNPEASEVISSKFPGRIEKLYVRESGRVLTAGTPIFTIYSEELQTLQQDYLLQLKQVAAFPTEEIYQSMRNAARSKLSLFGYSDAQIKALAVAKNVSATSTVYAKRSGVVRTINVTEGSYVTEGTPIVNLEDLGQLWVEADVYPAEVNLLKMGMKVKVRINGLQDREQTVSINYISPQINPGSQLLSIRAVIANPSGDLQPGMQADVLLPSASVSNSVKLPLAAVIRSAEGAHIWIRTGQETFSPRNVSTGAEDAENVVITSGLKDGEEVVISGAYLLNSEFILKKGSDPLTAHNHK
jgi:membrane fusion protein, copper/silver efflux system